MSVCEPVEPINLVYSSPNASEHFHHLDYPERMKQANTNKQPDTSDERLTCDYNTKGFNAIFYRTAQYLGMPFKANVQSQDYQKLHDSQFDSKKDDFQKEGDDPQRHKETSTAVSLEHGSTPRTAIHNATLRFNQGELVSIVGKHQAGKTTSLQLLSGRLLCGCKQVRGL